MRATEPSSTAHLSAAVLASATARRPALQRLLLQRSHPLCGSRQGSAGAGKLPCILLLLVVALGQLCKVALGSGSSKLACKCLALPTSSLQGAKAPQSSSSSPPCCASSTPSSEPSLPTLTALASALTARSDVEAAVSTALLRAAACPAARDPQGCSRECDVDICDPLGDLKTQETITLYDGKVRAA